MCAQSWRSMRRKSSTQQERSRVPKMRRSDSTKAPLAPPPGARREQFHYEVYMAMMQKKLNQCRIDDVAYGAVGMPYTFDQIADLSQVSPDATTPNLTT